MPGMSKSSKSRLDLIRASASLSVDSGGTLVSSSPTINRSLPRNLWALVIFDCAA